MPKNLCHYKKIIYSLAECAAESLNIKKIHPYKFNEFVEVIYNKYLKIEEEINTIIKKLSKKRISQILKEIISLSKKTDFNTIQNTTIYKYDRLLEEIIKLYKRKLPFSTLNIFFPYLNGARIFFTIITIFYNDKK